MKTSAMVRFAAVAALAVAPMFAHAEERSSVQRCMDVFASQNFADRPTTFRSLETEGVRLPLILNTGTSRVRLIASDRESGRVLATASCTVRNGVTRIAEVSARELVTAR